MGCNDDLIVLVAIFRIIRSRTILSKNKDISTVRKFYKLLILAMAICVAINISLFF